MNWAICTLAFFGFFRLGEILLTSTNFDPERHLAVGDIAVDSRQDPSLLRVNLKCSDRSARKRGRYLHREDRGRYLPSRRCTVLPCHSRNGTRSASAAIALHVQRRGSYQNFGQRCRRLGWLAQTLPDTASASEPRPPRRNAASRTRLSKPSLASQTHFRKKWVWLAYVD